MSIPRVADLGMLGIPSCRLLRIRNGVGGPLTFPLGKAPASCTPAIVAGDEDGDVEQSWNS